MEIKRSGYGRHLGVGCVLTGGGSLVPHTDELAAEVLGMEARAGRPMGLSGGLVEEVSDPKYATGVGLVLYGMRHDIIGGNTLSDEVHANGAATGESLMARIANRMKAWFDEL
jgi:cell division protein FtsA